MSNAVPFTSRIPRFTRKLIEFDGSAGGGKVGTVAVAGVSGAVLIEKMAVRCTEDLAGASATVEMGVAADTDALVAQTTATDIDEGDFWHDATPDPGAGAAITNRVVADDVEITVGTSDVTGGALEVVFWWLPMSDGAQLT